MRKKNLVLAVGAILAVSLVTVLAQTNILRLPEIGLAANASALATQPAATAPAARSS